MNRPTLHILARLLAPWRTIRRLEAENQRLEIKIRSAELLIDRIAVTELRDARLRHCPTHGQQPPNAWGCPECVRELRAELATAERDAEYLRGDLATAREAVRRLVRWRIEGYDSRVASGVYNWFNVNAMAGPLPPLPDGLVDRRLPK